MTEIALEDKSRSFRAEQEELERCPKKIKLTPASFNILTIQINLFFISSAYHCKQLFIKNIL